VRSRLEIEQHQRQAHQSSALANQYRDSCEVLENTRDGLRLSLGKSESEVRTMACAVTAAMQALLELVAQIASEMEIVQKNEVVLLSISAFLEQRLFASEEVYRERHSF